MANTEKTVKAQCRDNDMAQRLRQTLYVLVAVAYASLLLACATNAPLPGPESNAAAVAGEQRTVALLGATGMVGDFLLREALARGYTVRALARTPAKLDEFSSRITIVAGDARDPTVIAELLRGADVVISALGPVKADGDASRFINTSVTSHVLWAMQDQHISRYLVVSGAGVVMPGDERDLLGWWIRALAQIGLADALADKQAEYDLLAASAADWTLVRCPLIDAEPFRSPAAVSLLTPPAFNVRAGEVARFVIDQIDSGEFRRRGPFLGTDYID